MKDDIKRQEEVRRGEEAQQILNNPLWQEAVNAWNAQLNEQLRGLTGSPEGCQQVAQLLVAGDRFRQFFEQIADTGKMARIQLED